MSTDRITFQGPTEITKGSAITVTVRFRDTAAGADVTPTNVYWRVDDELDAEVQGWTSITPDTSVDIPVPASCNRNRNSARQVERRTLSVMVDRDLATQFANSFGYGVRNQSWPD